MKITRSPKTPGVPHTPALSAPSSFWDQTSGLSARCRVELHHLADLGGARTVLLPLRARRTTCPARRPRRTRRCPRRSRTGTRVAAAPPRCATRRCPSPARARRSWRSRACRPRWRPSSRSTPRCRPRRGARRPNRARSRRADGATVTGPSGARAAVELHDVHLAVLAPLEQVVAEHETAAVPVVVPFRRRHVVRRQPPELRRLRPVEGEYPEEAVTGPDVDEREPVGIDGDRSLDDVAGRERRQDVLAGRRVDEVDRAVVGAEHEPRPAVALEHGRLAGPARPAPVRHLAPVLGDASTSPRPGTARPAAALWASAPARNTCASGCPGT